MVLVYLHSNCKKFEWTIWDFKEVTHITMDKQPFKNILWKASFTLRTTSVSNRFWSPEQRSWLTKKLFSIAFASVRPLVIKTFHYYHQHTIEINLFSIYIGVSIPKNFVERKPNKNRMWYYNIYQDWFIRTFTDKDGS